MPQKTAADPADQRRIESDVRVRNEFEEKREERAEDDEREQLAGPQHQEAERLISSTRCTRALLCTEASKPNAVTTSNGPTNTALK